MCAKLASVHMQEKGISLSVNPLIHRLDPGPLFCSSASPPPLASRGLLSPALTSKKTNKKTYLRNWKWHFCILDLSLAEATDTHPLLSTEGLPRSSHNLGCEVGILLFNTVQLCQKLFSTSACKFGLFMDGAPSAEEFGSQKGSWSWAQLCLLCL